MPKKPKSQLSSQTLLHEDKSTQTTESDAMLEISRLQEQLAMLTMENKMLKGHAVHRASSVTRGTPQKASRASTLQESMSSKAKVKGCSCKGNCSSKLCGCVKKDKKCGHMCKCSASCQNQGDQDENSPTNLDNSDRTAGLFSPAIIETESKHSDDTYLMPTLVIGSVKTLKFSTSDEENEDIKEQEETNQITRSRFQEKETQLLKSISELKSSSTFTGNKENLNTVNISQLEMYENDPNFDPTKPKHQLARSPLRPANELKSSPSPQRVSDIPLPIPIPETVEEECPSPPELQEVQVDWSEHQAKLVPCLKCKRRFHPMRINKHKTVCKGY